ncbi:MAG: dienelactone hydrolase family protein [Bernardetiaceae bacterium]|jgi:carboxymethylenebutenolidase|nr:dienelactone hydrolase family protein [Bernardetiaceae bacterium]
MQKIWMLSLALFALPLSWWGYRPVPVAPPAEIICHGPGFDRGGHEAMVALAAQPAFAALHPTPLAGNFKPGAAAEEITYKTPDGQTAKAWEWKAKKKSKIYLLVIHEWWGLNDQIKQEAQKLYADLGEKVNVLALDLYDGKVATTREDASKYIQALNKDRGDAIVKGALEHAGKKAKILTIGWCMGGGWSLQASLLAGAQGQGCVIYYGRPEKDINKLKALNAEVLGIFGSQDKGIPVAAAEELDKSLKSLGKKMTYKVFDADHGFANPSNPRFNKEATEEAYKMTLAFFKDKI